MATLHVSPTGDLVPHDTDTPYCICGPTIKPMRQAEPGVGWLYVHHSLDGREAKEKQ